jgi:anti-sigma B factor antagonist
MAAQNILLKVGSEHPNANATTAAPAVLKLMGRLDCDGAAWLMRQVDVLPVDVDGASHWVLDMTQVEFIDSAGLVALMAMLQAAVEAGVGFYLCGLKPQVKLILEITQLDRVFQVVDSIDAIALEPTSAN